MNNEETVEETVGLPALMPNASLAVSLARAEVDQQIATARALPRSIQRAVSNITTLATLDEETAAECIYALPRGGKTIRGPSIRFAEIMASQWMNCRVGARVVHVDRIEGYVEAEGVFHDLETNVAQTARVRRQIHAKRGKGIDYDSIQLAGAAACSIARRNAILAGIPKGVARKGYLAVEEVIRGDIKTLAERRALALKAFGTMGVTPERVFAALGVRGEDDITLDHLTTLTGTRSAIKNGETTVEEAFPSQLTNHDKPKDIVSKLDAIAGETSDGVKVDPETGEITETSAAAKDLAQQQAGDAQRTGHAAGHQPAADPASASPDRLSAVKVEMENRKAEISDATTYRPPTSGATKDAGATAVSSSQQGQAPASTSDKSETKQPAKGKATFESGNPPKEVAPKAAAAKVTEVYHQLMTAGSAAAALGDEALETWLGGLTGDEEAMITAEQVKSWRKTAEAADGARG